AVMDVTYPSDQEQYLIIDAMNGGCRLDIDQINRRITGYVKNNHGGVTDNFANYFVIECSHPIAEKGVMVNDDVMPGRMQGEHDRVCGYLRFIVPKGEELTLRMASSFVSPEQAQINFTREVRDKSLIDVRDNARREWNEMLGRIAVDGGSEKQKEVFYSCLYRTLLFPRELHEYDSENNIIHYSPYDGRVHDGYMYTDNGFWDTFRAVHPLFTLVYPEVSARVVKSLLNTYDESGFLPEWASPGHRGCMIGNNSLSIITDAYVKGVTDFDVDKALKAMIHQTEAQGVETSVGRNGYKDYFTLGYVPFPDYPEAAAKTLEYAYADWCLSTFAKMIGDEATAQDYAVTALNYRNLFDRSFGFMRAKNKKGGWIAPFRPEEWGGAFTEGSSWHYTWSVMHDIEGLSRLMGGHEMMVNRLDSMFSAPPVYNYGTYGFVIHEIAEMVALNMGQYAHGNQPVQHAIYLYNYAGAPWKAQYHVREVLNRLYSSSPDGYCGDEDNGQTSAWYVFSAMGFYPVCPGRPEYVIGAPLFKNVTINLPEGKVFKISATENENDRRYINSAKLNGKNFTRNYLKHSEIVGGGELKVVMSDVPNLKRGTELSDMPSSMTLLK
ncbi:MAG: GH92 family glycosyl hydrolase, partial [Bacteroidales bacterium]